MKEKLLGRLAKVISMGEETLRTRTRGDIGEYVDSGKMHGFRSASLSFIQRVYGKDHSYYDTFVRFVDGYYPSDVQSGMEILKSIEEDRPVQNSFLRGEKEEPFFA